MDKAEFEALSKTCRLRLSDSEKELIQNDINGVISYFNDITQIDCDDLDPAYRPIEIPGRFRKDSVEKFGDVDLLLKHFKMRGRYALGPKL